MVAAKKKKKPVANPARGFATTSIASKAKEKVVEDAEVSAQASHDSVATKTAELSQGTRVGQEKIQANADSYTMASETPQQLEQRLEMEELQLLVDRISAKVKREAARHISKLHTDRRLLRGQAESLHTSSWFASPLRHSMLDLASGDSHDSVPADSRTAQNPSEDVLLSRLWALRLILQGIDIPESLIVNALKYILSRSDVDVQEQVWGLRESLEWLASNGNGELANYEAPKPALPELPAQDEDAINASIMAAACSHITKANKKVQSVAVKGHAAQRDAAELVASDTESDPEPDDMLAKYVEYKMRLVEHKPEVYNDDRCLRVRQANGEGHSSQLNATESRLLSRLRRMITDPLFDEARAEATWREKKASIFQDQIRKKRLGISDTKETNGKRSHTSSNTASEVSSEAEAVSLEMLADDDSGDSGLFGDMFVAQAEPGSKSIDPHEPCAAGSIQLLSFPKMTGTSPRRILEETCKARDHGSRLTCKMISGTTYTCRHAIIVMWSKHQDLVEAPYLTGFRVQATSRAVMLEMLSVAATGEDQSEGFACTAALHAIFAGPSKDFKASSRLPASFREAYEGFTAAKQEIVDKCDRELVQGLRGLLDERRHSDLDQEVILTKAFRDRSKRTSGTSTPSGNGMASGLATSTDPSLMDAWTQRVQSQAYKLMLEVRKELPMFQFREHALETVRNNQVVILCGETGCGKSTQMPAYILEQQMSMGKPCKIYTTEPRRISAISLAHRVSEELGEGKNAVGTTRSLVGYAIRLESQTSTSTRLVYATVGIVLRMLESKDGLDDLTHLIIDEVHERSIDTDFLLIVLKSLMVRRPDLKVVLMSATVDASRFSQYLGNAPIINVPGRTYPVRGLFLEDAIEMTKYHADESEQAQLAASDEDDLDASATKATDSSALTGYSKSTIKTLGNFDEYRIDYNLILALLDHVAKSGELRSFSKAILIFLPGISEIRQLADMIGAATTFQRGWLVYPLHSSFSSDEQQAAFKVPPKGVRKIVLATNIAETGITIPDVTCVVDTGKHKEMRFDERRQLSKLTQSFISKANAKQRRGRAGRVQEGICFHLFTKQRHDAIMAEQQSPEMLRLSLQDLIMRVKICKLGDIESTLAQALDPPSSKNIRRAIDSLIEVGALTAAEDLTPLGQQIAQLPLDAQLGKLILLGAIFSCADFALTSAAIASSKSPFLNPLNARRQADTVRLGYKRGDSDLLTTYNAYCAWRRVCKTPGASELEFCRKNFLSPVALSNIEDLKGQLLSSLTDANFITLSADERVALARSRSNHHRHRAFVPVPETYARNESNDILVQSVIAWSFYPKILMREGKGWRSMANKQSLSLHPTSVNKLSPSPTFEKATYLSFYSIMQPSSRFTNAQETTPVEAMALVLVSGDVKFEWYAGVIIVDGHRMRFKVATWEEMLLIKTLREKIRGILARCWRKPGRDLGAKEDRWWALFQEMFAQLQERRNKAAG